MHVDFEPFVMRRFATLGWATFLAEVVPTTKATVLKLPVDKAFEPLGAWHHRLCEANHHRWDGTILLPLLEPLRHRVGGITDLNILVVSGVGESIDMSRFFLLLGKCARDLLAELIMEW